MSEATSQRSATDVVGRYAAIVTTLVGLFVTANTAVTSYSRERIEHAAGFRAAVKAEEDYWSGLYQQYVAVLAQPGQDDRAKTARLLAISELATHDIPDFSEYSLGLFGGSGRQETAQKQLASLRQSLQDALTNELTSGPAVARNAQYIIANKSEARIREGGVVTVAAQQETSSEVRGSSSPGVSYATTTLAAGSPKGWDVDVFWCSGGNEVGRYSRASQVAVVLGRAADQNYSRRGFSLGRVRLRTLPAEQQATAGQFVRNADTVVADGGMGEQSAAAELAHLVQERSAVPLTVSSGPGSRTTWYLSVFICRTEGAAPSTTASAGARPTAVATSVR